jgi:hypothetical protein
MPLAITNVSAATTSREIVNFNIHAKDTWAFYPAKNIRQTANQLAEAMFQIAIVLSSASIVVKKPVVLGVGIALGVGAALLLTNSYLPALNCGHSLTLCRHAPVGLPERLRLPARECAPHRACRHVIALCSRSARPAHPLSVLCTPGQ